MNIKKSFPEWHHNTMSFFKADYFFREITCIYIYVFFDSFKETEAIEHVR